MSALERRRNVLTTALAILEVNWLDSGEPPIVAAFRQWLDSWNALGAVIAGMSGQDHDLELRQFPRGWGATFYPSGRAHSVIAGFGWALTPWAAVQKAAPRLRDIQRRDSRR